MRKTKKFGKIVNENAEALELYTKQRAMLEAAKKFSEKAKETFIIYNNLEKKYADGIVVNEYVEQGHRNWNYTYNNEETRKKMREEQKIYRDKYIDLEKKANELSNKAWRLDNEICIALWGYGEEEYKKRKYQK